MSTKEITIAGLVFAVSTPYAEGHALTAAEAKQLNQVRAENVRNNTAAALKKLADEAGEYSDEAKTQAANIVASYDAEYTFALGGASARRVTDPLERECMTIARAHLTATIKAKGGNVKDYDKEKIEAKVEELSEHPEIVKMAKQRLKERAKLADALNLDFAPAEQEAAE